MHEDFRRGVRLMEVCSALRMLFGVRIWCVFVCVVRCSGVLSNSLCNWCGPGARSIGIVVAPCIIVANGNACSLLLFVPVGCYY
jgi:hypothetical protein